MSGKISKASKSSRSAVNSSDAAGLTLNERILRECHMLYADADSGLVKMAAEVDIHLLAPRKKITILLIGNHSAGKSSFINWYIEEHVQKTGVAIETQGFTFVTSGRKRETLTGNATLHLYPHFEPLKDIEGLTEYLNTEISTSKQKKFSLVTFVDTPGLVDGDMKYPFDVNRSILWLGDLADLIFVFFDPIGQALCKRTLNLVESLNEKHAERMRFYLSKADEAGHEADRQRVMMQIVQELCKRPGLNRTGFDMPTIYIPTPGGKPSRCVNQIEDVARDIERTINQTVQSTLNTLEKDCQLIADEINTQLVNDKLASSQNLMGRVKGVLFLVLALCVPVILLLSRAVSALPKSALAGVLGGEGEASLRSYVGVIEYTVWQTLPQEYHYLVWVITAVLVLLCMLLSRCLNRRQPTLTRRKRKQLVDNHHYVTNYVHSKKQALYQKYLEQSVSEQEL